MSIKLLLLLVKLSSILRGGRPSHYDGIYAMHVGRQTYQPNRQIPGTVFFLRTSDGLPDFQLPNFRFSTLR